MVRILFSSIKNSGKVLNKLKSKGFLASSLSTYDIYILSWCLIESIPDLCPLSHFYKENNAFAFTSEQLKLYKLWSCQKMCDAFHYLLDSIYTQTKKKRPIFMILYRSIHLRCCNKNKTKMFYNVQYTKNGHYVILSVDLEELLNLMCTQLFPSSSGS